MLMVFFSEIFILLVKCNYVFMSENLAVLMKVYSTFTEDGFVKASDIICIKDNFLNFAASNEMFGLFLSDESTAEYKKITGLS